MSGVAIHLHAPARPDLRRWRHLLAAAEEDRRLTEVATALVGNERSLLIVSAMGLALVATVAFLADVAERRRARRLPPITTAEAVAAALDYAPRWLGERGGIIAGSIAGPVAESLSAFGSATSAITAIGSQTTKAVADIYVRLGVP